jgi:hypothetical protein
VHSRRALTVGVIHDRADHAVVSTGEAESGRILVGSV